MQMQMGRFYPIGRKVSMKRVFEIFERGQGRLALLFRGGPIVVRRRWRWGGSGQFRRTVQGEHKHNRRMFDLRVVWAYRSRRTPQAALERHILFAVDFIGDR